MTLAVVPIGRGRPPTLPHVLRALEANTDVTQVVTVGEPPTGVEPDTHIDSPNDRAPHLNILGHLRRVCDTIDAAEFMWLDDDMFILKPWVPGVYVRKYSIAKHLRDFPNKGTYTKAVRASVKLIEADGLDPEKVPCGPCHRPWLVETDRVRAVVDACEPVGGSFKTLYASQVETIPANDTKIVGRGVPHPDADVVSTYLDSWRYNAGRLIRERFTVPSRWELTAETEGTAVTASGHAASRHKSRNG